MEKQENLSLLEFIVRTINNCLVHIKLFFVIAAIPTLAMFIAVMWIWDPEYEVEAIVTPPATSGSKSIGGSLGKLLDNADLGSFSFGGSNDGEDVAWTFLNSWELHQKVIDKFGFEKIYEFDKEDRVYKADVLKKFRKNFSLTQNDEDMLEIKFRDKDYKLALQVVDFILYQADSMYNAYKTYQARQSKKYMDIRLDDVLARLDSLQNEFAKFQGENKYYDPKTQLEVSLKYLSTRQSERDAIVVEQSFEKAKRGNKSKRYEELDDQLKAVDASILQAVNGKQNKTGLVGLEKAPDLSMQYLRLENEIKIQVAVYKLLRQEREQLLLDEVNNQTNLVVLQPPWENDKRVFPKRGTMLVFTFLVASVLATVVCSVVESCKRMPEDSVMAIEIKRFKSIFKHS